MPNDHYPFTLTPLPYAYNALEPFISRESLILHHDKLLRAYVDNLNRLLAPCANFHNYPLKKLLCNISYLPRSIQTAVMNNAGGVYNHELYFDILKNPGTMPSGNLAAAIDRAFDSFDSFKSQFRQCALSVFGSGYAYLVVERHVHQSRGLRIVSAANQDTPLPMGLCPLMPADVWEHAYYLDYQNRRTDYVDNLFAIINWERVGELYDDVYK